MGRTSEFDSIGAGLERGVNGEKYDTMMAVGTAPWHYSYNQDLVNLLAEGTDVKSGDVNKVAGLDWNVEQSPAYMNIGGKWTICGTPKVAGGDPLPDFLVNYRTDNNRAIGVVKKGYHIFQNSEAPLFLDALVDSGDALYETAGSLHGGSQVWWLMKLPNDVKIGGIDTEAQQTYVLFSNSHDGSLSLTVSIVTIRVVCQNTLSFALSGAQRFVKIRHTKNSNERFAEARRALGVGFAYQQELAEMSDRMLNVSFTDAQFDEFLNSLVPMPEPVLVPNAKGVVLTKNAFAITTAKKRQDAIIDIYSNHPTQMGVKGTLWGAVNAVGFYNDHVAFTRGSESRFSKLTKGQTLSNKAFQKALTLV